jgi:hypothetical protein
MANCKLMGAKELQKSLKKKLTKRQILQLNFRKEAEYAKLFANPYTAAKEVLWMRSTPRYTQKID